MLPYQEIWQNIKSLFDYELPCSLKRKQIEVDLTLEDFINLKDQLLISSLDFVQTIDDLMSSNPAIDFTFRYKDEASMERNWQRDNTNISLYNVFNDILGLRFVLPIKKDQLELIATDFINACPIGEITCRLNPLNRYGYQGLHLYIRANTKTFPVEIQFWTRTDALLNQYLRDTIYTRFDSDEILEYATNLRRWLDEMPPLREASPIKPYVDYLYEKAFQDDDVEEVHSNE